MRLSIQNCRCRPWSAKATHQPLRGGASSCSPSSQSSWQLECTRRQPLQALPMRTQFVMKKTKQRHEPNVIDKVDKGQMSSKWLPRAAAHSLYLGPIGIPTCTKRRLEGSLVPGRCSLRTELLASRPRGPRSMRGRRAVWTVEPCVYSDAHAEKLAVVGAPSSCTP